MAEELVLAGIIGAPRGLKGEVFVEVHTDRADEVFEPGSKLHLQDAHGGAPKGASQGVFASFPKTLTVDRDTVHGGREILHFQEVTTREQADALRGMHLMTVSVDEEDAWYPRQLEGLAVLTPGGESLGKVTGLAQGSAHDFLLVDHDGAEVMVPFVSQLVPEVRIEDGCVIVDAPEGLF